MSDDDRIKENRVRALTKIYYSNPKIQQALLDFAKNREVVPRYYEGFGRRPDLLQYSSDIMGLVNKGATSFHASQELWADALKISSEMRQEELEELRKGWDLLIDIDSQYLDLSKIAANLVVNALEYHGIKNYGIKFSGSKGFHIIVSENAFPKEFNGFETRKMFPEWPRAITEYLFNWIEQVFKKEASKIMSFGKKEERIKMYCSNCGKEAKVGIVSLLKCGICSMEAKRMDSKTKRKLRCLNSGCAGILELIEEKEYNYCENCKDFENEKQPSNSLKNPAQFKEERGENVSEHAKFDLVLVSSRHLFRMPYSLHEKTALASVVIYKEELDNFNPRDANPLSAKIRNFLPENEEDEGKKLLIKSLEWKENQKQDEKKYEKNYNYEKNYGDLDVNVTENDFPAPIKKLLYGLDDGKKRGLFILITFLKSLNFPSDYINAKVREWNALNRPPLKEGYVKSQIDWHLKQKKKILPPNYDNESFYMDLKLLDKKPDVKNPIVEAIRSARRRK